MMRLPTARRWIVLGSFGASSLAQHIGLGKATRIATCEIYWPASRTTLTFHDLHINRFLEIREGDPAWRDRKLPRFALSRPLRCSDTKLAQVVIHMGPAPTSPFASAETSE